MTWVTNRIIRRGLIAILLLTAGSSFELYAQGNVSQWVKSYVGGKGKDEKAFASLMQYNPSADVVKELAVYVKDTNNTTFEYAVFLVKKIEKRVTDKQARILLVRTLLDCALKQEASLSKSALRTMTLFEKTCFTDGIKEDIRLIAAHDPSGRQDAILLLGYAGESGDISYLNGLGKYTALSKQDKYYRQLALARLNDGEAVQELCNRVKEKKIDDDLVMNILPDLIYTRNKKIFDLLVKEILNETPNCISANNDSQEHILCAYRIMEQLAGKIVGFPVQTDRSGEINGDYAEALTRARKWILSSKMEYSINTNQY